MTVALLDAARTAVTGRSRAQASATADELASSVIRALAERTGVRARGVVLGNCTGPGGNLARLAALGAGLGHEAVGWTVDAQCGSGAVAVARAASWVEETGEPVAAGGTESASTAPVRSIDDVPYVRARFAPAGFPDPDMLDSADRLAHLRGIGRERQERFAARSHRLAREIVLPGERIGDVPDDGPRPFDSRVGARFPTLLDRPHATLTAATTARISDGAGLALLVPERSGLGPRTVLRGSVLVGGDPSLPGLVPAAAIRDLLKRLGLGLADLACIEVVEAFAPQVLAVLDELGLAERGPAEGGTSSDPSAGIDRRVNAAGGALALGHPWGASGALGVIRLHHRLLSLPAGSLGVTACAIGGGMAAALVLERKE